MERETFCGIIRLETKECESLDSRPLEIAGRLGMPVGGSGVVCAAGGLCLVGAFYGVLHWRPVPYRRASPPEKAGIAAFRYGLRARHGRDDQLLDVLLPEFGKSDCNGRGLCVAGCNDCAGSRCVRERHFNSAIDRASPPCRSAFSSSSPRLPTLNSRYHLSN